MPIDYSDLLKQHETAQKKKLTPKDLKEISQVAGDASEKIIAADFAVPGAIYSLNSSLLLAAAAICEHLADLGSQLEKLDKPKMVTGTPQEVKPTKTSARRWKILKSEKFEEAVEEEVRDHMEAQPYKCTCRACGRDLQWHAEIDNDLDLKMEIEICEHCYQAR